MKILIGIITYDSDWYCLKEFAESLNRLKRPLFNSEILVVDNSDTLNYVRNLRKFLPNACIVHYQPPKDLTGFKRFRNCELKCRQMVKDYAIENCFDYLFFLDSDIICEPDVLEKLAGRGKDIVCGLFRYRNPPEGRPLWFRTLRPVEISPTTGVWILTFIKNSEVEGRKELLEIDACGFGAILIKTEVLQKIDFKKSPNDHYGVDIHFCYDAKQAGHKIFGDPTANCKHLYKQCARRRESGARAF